MEKYHKKTFLIVFLLTCFPFFSAQAVYAEENNNVGFSVSPNYNDRQNKDSSYFDLSVTPHSEQTIGVTITNTSKETSKYTIRVIQASTNKNGLIDYTDPKGRLTNPPIALNKVATYDKEIQLESGQAKEVPIHITIPKEEFKGEVLGGINVTKEIPQGEKQPQLVNQYSYVIGLRFREGLEEPARALSAGKAKPDVAFGKAGVIVPIVNNQPNAMGKLRVDSILKRDGKEIKKETYTDREIAPNSIYPYSLSWDQKDYVPGDYQLAITITDTQSHKWSFSKDFHLEAEEVSKIKDAAVHPQKEDHRWIWFTIGSLFVLILLLLAFILKYKNRNHRGGDNV